jgi:quercetin dioxygenase-like cupin family protein
LEKIMLEKSMILLMLGGMAEIPAVTETRPGVLLDEIIPRPAEDVHVSMEVVTLSPRPGGAELERLSGHRHPGRIYAYVLDGEVHSMLDDGPAALYGVGQAWREEPGQVHRIVNVSDTRPARLLVVRVEPSAGVDH